MLNDLSTSIGKSASRVGDGSGEEGKRLAGKDSTMGDEEKRSMLFGLETRIGRRQGEE